MRAFTVHSIALAILVLTVIAAEFTAARPSGNAAAKRRRLSGLKTSAQAAARNVTTRGITDCVRESAENFFASFSCMHGRYCGGGCSGEVDGESFKASPIDELDRACFFHDKCFTSLLGCDCKDCHCNAQLGAVASQLWEDGRAAEDCGCGLGERTCSNTVLEAYTVLAFANALCSKDCAFDCPDAPIGDECSGADMVYETDLSGGDYKDVTVSDWHECCMLCGNEDECRAWTYTDGVCYMKGDSWTAEPREGLVSGYFSSS